MWSLPEILVIHFKRFQYTKYWRDKIDQIIDFPVEGLDLSKYLVKPTTTGSQIYDLFAVSEHYGGMGGGHYTAKVKGQDNGWYSCDDSSTSSTSPSSTVSTAAYVLFYRKRGSGNYVGVGTSVNKQEDTNTNEENTNTNQQEDMNTNEN